MVRADLAGLVAELAAAREAGRGAATIKPTLPIKCFQVTVLEGGPDSFGVFLGAWKVRLWLLVIIQLANCCRLIMSFIGLVHMVLPLLSELHFAHRCIAALIDCFQVEFFG